MQLIDLSSSRLLSVVVVMIVGMVTSVKAFQSIVSTTGSVTRATSRDISSSSSSSALSMGFDLSGNSWKPDSGKMGSTDTGDYFPEDFDLDENQSKFTEGMMGSQSFLNRGNQGPALPGLENLGADAVIRGGIATASEIPAGMTFIPSSVPDGVYEMSVASSSSGGSIQIDVPPVCMTFEDYYAAFADGAHPSLSVSPVTGRMDRRGGEPTIMTIACDPNGQAGKFVGTLVINLPEDNSKICYQIVCTAY
jgi:hypothetical protein